MTAEQSRQQIAEVLAEHYVTQPRGYAGECCTCGWESDLEQAPDGQGIRHVAAAIAAALPDTEQAVREALDKVAGWANEWLADVREEQPTRRAQEFHAILRAAIRRCECNPAEVENGVCVKCGKPFPVGGSV